MRSLDEFEKKIGYKFKNRNLLITACLLYTSDAADD